MSVRLRDEAGYLNPEVYMDLIDRCAETIRGSGLSVVFPEGDDPRILTAACQLRENELAEPILLGQSDALDRAAAEAGVSLSGLRTIDPDGSPLQDEYITTYATARGLDPPVARRLVRRPLFFGGMMVARGDAGAMVGGVRSATANVIQAAALTIGYAPGIRTASSFFLMAVPGYDGDPARLLLFSDCAVNVDPSPEELADIALASAESACRLLGTEPRVALLSFSSRGSAAHEKVDRVRAALEFARQRAPDLKIDGELQADSALDLRVAERKLGAPGEVAGHANVLIFPDLNAGNIAYKLTQYLARARAYGPFLQGFARPVSDLSRGAGIDDIAATTVITLASGIVPTDSTAYADESTRI